MTNYMNKLKTTSYHRFVWHIFPYSTACKKQITIKQNKKISQFCVAIFAIIAGLDTFSLYPLFLLNHPLLLKFVQALYFTSIEIEPRMITSSLTTHLILCKEPALFRVFRLARFQPELEWGSCDLDVYHAAFRFILLRF